MLILKKGFRQVLVFLLSINLIISSFSLCVNAEDNYNKLFNLVSPNMHRSFEGVTKDIYNGIAGMEERIDISKYGLEEDKLADIYEQILLDSPELFYIDNSFKDTVRLDNGKIIEIIPDYLCSVEEAIEKEIKYQEYLDQVLRCVYSDFSDLEKILYVHEYIVNNFSYDNSYTYSDVYSFFEKGIGVCESYTKLFTGLMTKLGIKSTSVVSDKMNPNHTWNLVELNGNWYHVDNTWDDAYMQGEGVNHNNFLVSDSGIEKTGHFGYKMNNGTDAYVCDSQIYENSFINSVCSSFAYYNGKWYFVDVDKSHEVLEFGYLASVDIINNHFSATTITKCSDLIDIWNNFDEVNSCWPQTYSNIIIVDNSIFYSTPTEVYKYDDKTGNSISVYKYADNNKEIYGLLYDKNKSKFFASLKTSPNDKDRDLVEIDLSKTSATYFDAEFEYKTKIVFADKELKPAVAVKYKNNDLIENKDYILNYLNNYDVGEGLVEIIGIGEYAGAKRIPFKILPKNIADLTIIASNITTEFSGTIRIPVTIKHGSKVLQEGYDYTFVLNSDTLNLGVNTVTIKGINNYGGTVDTSFLFLPKPKSVKTFKVSSQTSTSIKLSWSVVNCSGYYVYRATSKNGTYTKIATIPSNVSTFTSKGLKSGTTYYYKIYSVIINSSGKLISKSDVTALTATTLPATPKVKLKALSGKKIKVSYPKVTGATKYLIYYSTKKSSGYKLLTTTTKLSYTKTKLKKGVKYYFKVKACKVLSNKNYYSALSSVKYVKAK